jgi:putative thioredoxin
MTVALEHPRAHHDVATGRREAVEKRHWSALPRLLRRDRSGAGVDVKFGHGAQCGGRRPDILGRVIFDATESSFEQDVVERSKQIPVVVDFWAEWCGPCRALGPVLERAVTEREGKVALAKVDTDANPGLASAFQVQGIPAVKAFKDGRVVAEFTGVQPPPAVERFLDGLLPSEADALVQEGGEAELRRALELEPGRADAAVPLARMLHARGETDEALELLGNVAGSFAADGLAARIRLEEDAAAADAFAALDAGDPERGLDGLIEAIGGADGSERRDDLRRAVVGVLDELGVEHPLARDARRKLAAAIY